MNGAVLGRTGIRTFVGLFVVTILFAGFPPRIAHAADACDSPANPIVAENCLTGTPQSTWDVSGAGDPSIQGFATDISVNVGDTVSFKIDTDADRLSHRHLSAGLLRRRRRSPRRRRRPLGDPPADAASLPVR